MSKALLHSPFGQEVKLLAVTKNHSTDEMQALYDCGIRDFGENRVQELLSKFSDFEGKADFQLIGTLQKNKVKYILDKVNLIQSVDSLELIEVLNARSEHENLVTNVLLQVNTAREPQKHGFEVEKLDEALEKAFNSPHLSLSGLMCMAPDTEDENTLRDTFNRTRAIFEKEKVQYSLKILSMGMTSDFEIAIECGSNMVRIGRALCE
jgi:pyridoxal phosphate enzyme (YggS family)